MLLSYNQSRQLFFALTLIVMMTPIVEADRVYLKNGAVIEADAAWEDAESVWYRRGGMTYSIERGRVRRIESADEKAGARENKIAPATPPKKQLFQTKPQAYNQHQKRNLRFGYTLSVGRRWKLMK